MFGWGWPLPNAASAAGTRSAICLSMQGYSGAYLASTSRVGLDVTTRLIRLFRLTWRKLFRSTDALVSDANRFSVPSCLSTRVLLVVVRSDNAWRTSGAACENVSDTDARALMSAVRFGSDGLSFSR